MKGRDEAVRWNIGGWVKLAGQCLMWLGMLSALPAQAALLARPLAQCTVSGVAEQKLEHGHWQDAYDSFTAALADEYGRPVCLWWQAMALERSEKPADLLRAKDLLRRCMEIERCTYQLAAGQPEQAQAFLVQPVPPHPAQPSPVRRRTWLWTLLGVGSAAVVVSAVSVAVITARDRDLVTTPLEVRF